MCNDCFGKTHEYPMSDLFIRRVSFDSFYLKFIVTEVG